MIDVRNADVWLGQTRAVAALDWRLTAGEHWLVTGPNGSGKSSFLRLLHGQLRPALGGSISWPGLGNPGSVWTLRRSIGWVSPELHAAYRYPATVFECLASGLRSSIGLVHRPSYEDREHIETLLDTFALRALRDRPLSTLSYGQMRLALIARALAAGPRVLLLDEPWEGLDPASIDTVLAVLDGAARAGTQLVCVSHLGNMGFPFTDGIVFDAGLARARSR